MMIHKFVPLREISSEYIMSYLKSELNDMIGLVFEIFCSANAAV